METGQENGMEGIIMINFNVPPYAEKAMGYIQECVKNQKICGDGPYTKKCNEWIEERTGTAKCLLTTSCTHALEMAAMLCGLAPGDEVIMPTHLSPRRMPLCCGGPLPCSWTSGRTP